jgi:hypothetical protein
MSGALMRRADLRPAQTAAIERMRSSAGQLVALRMGAGKTASTLTVIVDLLPQVRPWLVVAPLRVAEMVWHQEAARWQHTKALRIRPVLGSPAARQRSLDEPADVYVINREVFGWLVALYGDAWPFRGVVIDETRGFKDRGSKAWRALKAVRRQIERLYLLTGTPAPNSLEELWPQVSIIDGGQRLGRGITAFRNRWFVPDKRNGLQVYSWKPRPGAEQEIHAAVADIMVVAGGAVTLPERIDNTVPVRIDMRRYRQVARDSVSGEIVAANAAVLAGKLAQLANGAVYDETGAVVHVHDAKLDALEEIAEQGEPLLVLTTYRHDQARIRQRFPAARVFDGPASLADWQAGKAPMLVMHPASGGHGVDGLQHGGSTIVWFGLPFSLDLYEQANARIHRPGQRASVVVHHLVAAGTIDERIMAVLQAKGDMQQALLDAVHEARGQA